jgi:hypothetical protein
LPRLCPFLQPRSSISLGPPSEIHSCRAPAFVVAIALSSAASC